jgi:hypothetical protein
VPAVVSVDAAVVFVPAVVPVPAIAPLPPAIVRLSASGPRSARGLRRRRTSLSSVQGTAFRLRRGGWSVDTGPLRRNAGGR